MLDPPTNLLTTAVLHCPKISSFHPVFVSAQLLQFICSVDVFLGQVYTAAAAANHVGTPVLSLAACSRTLKDLHIDFIFFTNFVALRLTQQLFPLPEDLGLLLVLHLLQECKPSFLLMYFGSLGSSEKHSVIFGGVVYLCVPNVQVMRSFRGCSKFPRFSFHGKCSEELHIFLGWILFTHIIKNFPQRNCSLRPKSTMEQFLGKHSYCAHLLFLSNGWKENKSSPSITCAILVPIETHQHNFCQVYLHKSLRINIYRSGFYGISLINLHLF